VQYSCFDKKRKITMPHVLSEELAELIGFHVGDGYCNILRSGTKVDYIFDYRGNQYNPSEIEYYNKFLKNALNSLFNFKQNPNKRSKGTYGFTFRSKAILMFFRDVLKIPIGKKSHTVQVPDIIINSPQNMKLAFLRGLFKADGCIRFRNQSYPIIKLTSASKLLIADVCNMLINLGFKTSVCLNEKQFDKRTQRCYIRHELFLNGHKNYDLWKSFSL
jgi:intein/homing endonuclease